MATRLLTLLTCAFAASLPAQVTFNGMGDPNGAIGSGSMVLDDDGTDLTIQFNVTTGLNFIPETVVLYVDSRPGEGFADNSTFTDNSDAPRIAASGLSGADANGVTQRAGIVFPAGFAADYAIVVENGATTVLQLSETGPHAFQTTVGQTKVQGTNNQPGTVTTVLPLSAINDPIDLVFVSTYVLAGNSSRTNESHTEPIATAPGFTTHAFQNTSTYRTAVPMPVALRRFAAEPSASGVALTWETASERDNAGFAVERSRDGAAWTELTFVTGAGDATEAIAYDYTDVAAAAGTNYYRLRQVDFDGVATYSPVVTVDMGLRRDAELGVVIEGAHPVQGEVALRNALNTHADIQVFDFTGRRVADFRIAPGATYDLDMSAWAAGTYVLRAGGAARPLIVR